MRRSLLMVAAAAGLMVAGRAPASLILNGGFESPVLPAGEDLTLAGGSSIGAWSVVGVDVLLLHTLYGEPGNGVPAFNAVEGLNSVDLTGASNTGPTNGVSQSVATVPGVSYQLSFYVGRASGNSFYATAVTVDLSINGAARVSYTNDDSSPGLINWKEFSVDFVADSATTNVTFFNGTPLETSEAGLDDVRLVAIPEPGVGAVAAVPLMLMGRRRRANELGCRLLG